MAPLRLAALTAAALCLGTAARADEPRTIVGLYADATHFHIENYRLFHAAEMPLNYLGLTLEAHNAVSDVPDIANRTDVRGVLIWLQQNNLPDPDKVIDMIAMAVKRNIPVIMLEQVPGALNAGGGEASPERAARALGLIGVKDLGGFKPYTFDAKMVSSDPIVGFERKLVGPLPQVDVIVPSSESTALLTLQRGDGTRTSPILLTPQGAYVAPDYAVWGEPGGERARWWIDPFALFSRVYKTDALPKPDPTTLSGRRVYYSHIDGDGWLNVSYIENYIQRRALSSEVILREAITPYPDLPVTVAPIAADLDPKFGGTAASQSVARALFALPQVELGSHTYTHPYQWSYFAPQNYKPSDELRYRKFYAHSIIEPGYDGGISETTQGALEAGYASPRAYGDIPFNLDKEIRGAADYISSFAPAGKRVRVVQWSGDTGPFGEAVAAATKAGLANLNGGDTRKDNDFPSYISVAPYGRLIGGQRQIYSSGANENLYTDNWTRNYGAFRQTLATAANTGRPLRVAAVNIYYHMYSGEREASLVALKSVLDTVSKMELAPIGTARYSEIVQGFYTARLEPAGPLSWRVRNRGALATLRFDRAAALNVDYAKSEGVLGDRHVGDVLYVAMDGANAAPLVALKSGPQTPQARLVLQDARWEIWNLQTDNGNAEFAARGFGPGEMRWRAAPGSAWRIEVAYKDRIFRAEAVAGDNGILTVKPPRGAEEGVKIRLFRTEAKGA